MNSVLNPEAPEFYPHLTKEVQNGFLETIKAVRISNKFPIGSSYDLYQTFTNFNVVTYKIRENVVIQSNKIMAKQVPSVNLKCDGFEEINTDKIIHANDIVLDRVNINMDTLTGVNAPSQEFERSVKSAEAKRSPVIATMEINGQTATLITAKNIARPQLLFKDPVDNSEKPFVPRIFDKPNSMKPLALKILYNKEGQPYGHEHPYKMELEAWEPPDYLLKMGEPPVYPPGLEQTPLTMVDTEPLFEQLLEKLAHAGEIAVDLEHHSYRSYQGFTCLIQISIDDGGDFIIDALALREHIHKLNLYFTDPKKVKVFHGAENDVLWLQRDFGVYVVGMFDTHQAARVLRLPRLSLLHLLKHYCKYEADKSLQLADWRMRPLPADLVRYARTDTHYLLYISRCMRRDLIEADPRFIYVVIDNSRRICKQTYHKSVVHEESHLPLYVRSQKKFNSAQMAALRLLYRWRDSHAREQDESVSYLLPNHMLMALAEELPREMQGLSAVCVPMPPFLKQNAEIVHRMILSCRMLPEEPRLYEMPASVMGMLVPPSRHWPQDIHDLAHFPDRSMEAINLDLALELLAASDEQREPADVRVLDADSAYDELHVPPELAYLIFKESRSNAKAQMFVTPYDRYRMYRAIRQTQELKEIKEKEAKVAAICKGNELIREEVLTKLQRAHAELERQCAATEAARAATEAARAATAAPEPTSVSEQTSKTAEITNTSQRKRKIIEQKDSADPTTASKKVLNKGDPDAASNVYKRVNYKTIFYTHVEKEHKQPKMKIKKS